ncbi:MAG: ATP synthase subunit I [Gammaproteobacteria bacterium]|nr:ATP synthase subunit I [Gammaproteobacteria bacterium]
MKTQVKLLLTVQSVMMLVFLALVLLLQLGDWISALTGCLASLVPSIYFSIRMLRQADNNEAAAWLSYAYRSEIAKWVMAGIIFAVAFTSGYPWDPMILFIGYLLVQVSGMFVPLIQKGI